MSTQSVESGSQPGQLQRTDVSLLQRGGHVVLPADEVDQAEEHNRLRSGSKWQQHDLQLLKVNFEPTLDVELPMLDIEHEWSPSQRQRIFSLFA
jgi:hypothetical protein